MTEKLDVNILARFIGTSVWFKHHQLKNITYTEDVRYVAIHGGAYWLVDDIAFAQLEKKITAEPFQMSILKVDRQQAATLTCEDGNYSQVYERLIEYTDLPLPEIKFYYTNYAIMLLSEY